MHRRFFQRTLHYLMSSGDEDIMARAERYIRTHFMDNITGRMWRLWPVSSNYLSKQFHSKKGMNLREYINTIRIEEAKRLLLTTNHSVSDVAGGWWATTISLIFHGFPEICRYESH